MATTTSIHNKARYLAATGALDLSSGNIVAILVSSSYTPNLDSHHYISDITNELSGNGYSRQTLTYSGVTRVSEDTSNKTIFTSEKVEFTASGGSIVARRMLLAKDTGTPSTSPILCNILLDNSPADVTVASGNKLSVSPDATNGWFYL
jgi:hypothetical protein